MIEREKMDIVDQKQIEQILNDAAVKMTDADVFSVIDKALQKKGLSLAETAVLIMADKRSWIDRIFSAAEKIKQDIYGERLVLFAPLYVSNYCVNDCAYCNFHLTNDVTRRKRLSLQEIKGETECLVNMGHKRVLVEFGEDPDNSSIEYICDAIRAIYSVSIPKGKIRRVNVNIAATSVENYKRLKKENIGTYQLFQETYHRETYEALHKGPKGDYDRQLTAHNRAREAGLDDLGIGVLFGLYDWRFEELALLSHAKYMEENLGVGPHTISVPRFREAPGVFYKPAFPVSDDDFLKLIAILRLAVPYTGMILSTREPPDLRRRAFHLGISQASAASVCVPGGYSQKRDAVGQFNIADDRPVDQVIRSVVEDGLIPSFCTACYRIGRTGEAFMDLAKPGDIHNFCRSNAILTFAEYLEDFADPDTMLKGGRLIEKYLAGINDERLRKKTQERLLQIKKGKRDLYF